MIYIDFERELVATEDSTFWQIRELEDFKYYCRNNWLELWDEFSSDFQACVDEIVEDREYRDREDVLLEEDLPDWAYEEVQSRLAPDWIAQNYRGYEGPDEYGKMEEIPHYQWEA